MMTAKKEVIEVNELSMSLFKVIYNDHNTRVNRIVWIVKEKVL